MIRKNVKIYICTLRILSILFFILWGGIGFWGLLFTENIAIALLILLLTIVMIIFVVLFTHLILAQNVEKIIILNTTIKFILMTGKEIVVDKKDIEKIKLIDGTYTFYIQKHQKIYYIISISPVIAFQKPKVDPLINALNFPYSVIEE